MKTRFAKISVMLSIILFFIAFSSCKEEEDIDGDYDLYDWEMYGEEIWSVVNVDPAQESTYPLVCTGPTGFSKIAIEDCQVNGVYLRTTDDNPQIIEWDWFTIDLEGREMTVSFKPNDTGKERTLYISPQAKDKDSSRAIAPCYFYFKQAAQEGAESVNSEDSEDTGE